jgi:hypothetical protein
MKGEAVFSIAKVDPVTGEIAGVFESVQPSDTDLGAKAPKDVKITGLWYDHAGSAGLAEPAGPALGAVYLAPLSACSWCCAPLLPGDGCGFTVRCSQSCFWYIGGAVSHACLPPASCPFPAAGTPSCRELPSTIDRSSLPRRKKIHGFNAFASFVPLMPTTTLV